MLLVVSQIIGLLAVALYLLSFQLKKRKQMVVTTCLSNALYVLQYILLGAFSGAVMDFLSAVSSFFAAKKNRPAFRRWSGLIAAVSFALITAAGIILAVVQKSAVELIPIAGALLQTGGLWLEDEQTIRKFGLASAPFWLVYNLISQAYGASIGSVLAICSSVSAIVRYRKSRDTVKADRNVR